MHANSPFNEPSCFMCFNALPREIRFMIWELALPEARIVLLRHMPFIHSDPDWYKRVRSDQAVAATVPPPFPEHDDAESDYDFFELSEKEMEALIKVAEKRRVTQQRGDNQIDNEYLGNTSRAVAERVVQQVRDKNTTLSSFGPCPIPGVTCPMILSGFLSGASIPIVSLVCRESRIVASKFYVRSFATPRAAPAQTYFDFQRDTLYLDHLTRHSYEGGEWSGPLEHQRFFEQNFLMDEMARVKNLAVSGACLPPRPYRHCPSGDQLCISWLHTFAEIFPGLERFIVVTAHCAWNGVWQPHQFRELWQPHRSRDQQMLRFIDGPESDNCLFQRSGIPSRCVDAAEREWNALYPGRRWCFPAIEWLATATEAGEQRKIRYESLKMRETPQSTL